MNILSLLFIGLAPLLILIPLFIVFLNLIIFGLQNRNISYKANLNIRTGFLLGTILGPLGMLINLMQAIKPKMKSLIFGLFRVLFVVLINKLIITAANLDIVYNVLSPFFIYIFGITFILRGKESFKFSVHYRG
tara:strand:- start:932 stop:1333 length:402 start_codon:yes stop_codon:yes gene_type:complete